MPSIPDSASHHEKNSESHEEFLILFVDLLFCHLLMERFV